MRIVAKKRELLGTVIEIKLPELFSSFFSVCFDEIQRIEKTYSRFLENSELTILNQNLDEWQPASDEFLFLVAQALFFSQKTDGNFDITVKTALDNLGYDKDYSFTPKKDTLKKRTIKEKINKIKSKNPIKIDKKNKKIKLKKEIEFGGLGKGFALDQVASILDTNKVDHYYINAGGDVIAKKGKGMEPWVILLEHPDDPEKAIGTMELDSNAIASSSPNKRKWRTYHHLIDPKTGMPAHDMKSLFVLAKTGIEADAYATALFISGFENAIKLAGNLPIDVLLISKQNKMFRSPGFKVRFFDGWRKPPLE